MLFRSQKIANFGTATDGTGAVINARHQLSGELIEAIYGCENVIILINSTVNGNVIQKSSRKDESVEEKVVREWIEDEDLKVTQSVLYKKFIRDTKTPIDVETFTKLMKNLGFVVRRKTRGNVFVKEEK